MLHLKLVKDEKDEQRFLDAVCEHAQQGQVDDDIVNHGTQVCLFYFILFYCFIILFYFILLFYFVILLLGLS